MGKKGRGERKMEEKKEDGFASLPPSSTRAGTAYQLPDVTKVEAPKGKVDVVRLLWSAFPMKVNTAQLSTNTNAAQAVASAAAVEAAASAEQEAQSF